MTEAAPHPTALAQDVLCIGCGYNLRGLDPTSRCPECGLTIADSNHGDRLIYADPAWLKKLRVGASLKLWNILITLLTGFFGGFLIGVFGGPYPHQLLLIIFVLGAPLGLWATFCITTQEPRTALTEDPITLCKLIRICALTTFVGAMLNQFGGSAIAPSSQLRGTTLLWIIISLVSNVAGLLVMIGELKYFRGFALRAPDLKLVRSTRIVMWGLGITLGLSSLGRVVLSAILVPKMAAMKAASPASTASTTTGIGYTAAVTESPIGAATTPKPGTTSSGPVSATPLVPMPGIASLFLGIRSCIFFGVSIFFLWYVCLLSRYRKLFQSTITQIQAGLDH